MSEPIEWPDFHEAIDIWEHYYMAANVVSRNTEELISFFRKLSLPGELSVAYLQAVSSGAPRHPVRDQVELEVNRLVLNYLASIASLIDISRNTMKHYEGSVTAVEYHRRTSAMRDRGLSPLLVRLRAHVLHHERLPWATVVHLGGSDRLLDVVMRRDELLAYPDVGGTAKRYLAGLAASIPFVDLVIEYGRENGDLVAWMWTQMGALYPTPRPDDWPASLMIRGDGAKPPAT